MDGLLELQLYKNPCYYPKYSETITPIGAPFTVTPRNLGLESGYIDVGIDFNTLTQANYLGITNQNFTFYAYIDRLEHVAGEHHFRIIYHVDPLRTYKDKITLGCQYVARNSTPTLLYDELLGGGSPYPEITITQANFGHPNSRVLVVQAHPQDAVGEDYATSNTPVHPTLYDFYLKEYDVRNPLGTSPIDQFFALCREFDPYLIVTAYSIPWIDTTELTSSVLPINNEGYYAEGWGKLPSSGRQSDRFGYTKLISTPEGLTKVDSSFTIVIPTAGVLQVPIELLQFDYVYLRRDIDVFTGLVNYQLVDENDRAYGYSIRGGSVNTIPIIGNPEETYISQNQNALSTALIGDVATIAGGAALTATGAGSLAGGGMMLMGAKNLISRQAQIKDAGTSYSNPPAFLGSALAYRYTDYFYIVTKKSRVENEQIVHTEKGYPQERIMLTNFPSKGGYLETRNCNIETDGSVPVWAVTKINQIFDSGLKVV